MTGIELEEMNENDQKAKDAEILAEEILTPHRVFKAKFGSQRRKSILNPVEEKPLLNIDTTPNTDPIYFNKSGIQAKKMASLVCLANAAQAAAAFKMKKKPNWKKKVVKHSISNLKFISYSCYLLRYFKN